jgi:protein-S-isoprenylcysteine O-methyltransferase Ste14
VPTTILNSPSVSRIANGYGGTTVSFGTGCDIAGIILWVLGFACEVAADVQKYRHKMVNNPPKGALCDSGVWYFSRRPNYFGEILLWFGIWLLAISPAVYDGDNGINISQRGHDALLGSLVSPLFTAVLLLFVSGVPLAEKPSQEKYYLMSYGVDGGKTLEPYGKTQHEPDPWKRMKGYRERTSLVIPLPPMLYKPLPQILKTALFLDLPMFNFDEDKDGPKAIEQERKKKNQGNDNA